jgi:hypothetical protein
MTVNQTDKSKRDRHGWVERRLPDILSFCQVNNNDIG